MPRLSLEELTAFCARTLEEAGAGPEMAASTARGLVAAQAQGLNSHGLNRLYQYAAHLRNGRLDGKASPRVIRERGGAVLVDAADGLAHLACELAIREAIARAREFGVSWAAVANSHHFGVAADHLRPVAAAGQVGLAFSNSPAALPAPGGRRALLGTNPIAAVLPRRDAPPVVIDLSLSRVARGKIMVAAQEGKPIPPDWALDREGNPTTDAQAGLDGVMLPAGGAKGSVLALLVEVLCCGLTGARLGFEVDPFFSEKGNRPRIGQAFVVLDPGAFAGADVFQERLEALLAAMLAEDGLRLPGDRRRALAERAAKEGLEVSAEFLAGPGPA